MVMARACVTPRFGKYDTRITIMWVNFSMWMHHMNRFERSTEVKVGKTCRPKHENSRTKALIKSIRIMWIMHSIGYKKPIVF